MHKLLSFSSKNSTPCKRKDSCSECNYDSLISQHKLSISTEHYLFSMLIPNFMAELNLMWIHTKLGKLHLHGIRYRHFQDVTTSVPLRESDNMLLFSILLTKELKISHCLTTKLDMFKAAPSFLFPNALLTLTFISTSSQHWILLNSQRWSKCIFSP